MQAFPRQRPSFLLFKLAPQRIVPFGALVLINQQQE